MSITREQLKEGETYVDDEGEKRKIISIGELRVFYSIMCDKRGVVENIWIIENFMRKHNLVKPEPKKLGEEAG